MAKYNGNEGKLAENLFRQYQIYKVCGAGEELIEDATGIDEWENLTDIDFITRSPGGKPIFHEVKEELHQFTGGYYNITAEALSKRKVVYNGKEYGFTCEKDINRLYEFNNRTACESCDKYIYCRSYYKAIAPGTLQQYLIERGEKGNYKNHYSVKYADGWMYKNRYVHADWFHFWLPFEDEKGNIKAVYKEKPFSTWPDCVLPTERIITRLPFDFFLSIRYDRLFQLVEEYCKHPTFNNKLHQLPIKETLIEYDNNMDGIKIVPFVHYRRAGDAKEYHEPMFTNENYVLSRSLAEKAGFTVDNTEREIPIPFDNVTDHVQIFNQLAQMRVFDKYKIEVIDSKPRIILYIKLNQFIYMPESEEFIVSSEKKNRGYREGRNETPLQVAAKALTNFTVRIAWEL